MTLSKILLSAAALGALAVFPFAGTGCERILETTGAGSANLPAVSTVKAERRTIEEKLTVSGFVEAETETEIKSEINGRIVKITTDNGEFVKKGDLLVEIDPSTYQLEVDSAERTERQRELDLEKTERDMLRIKGLYENDFATEQDYLDSVTEFETAKLQLEIASASLATAKEDLAKTQIRAPHDGMVSDRDVYVGNVITGAGSVSDGTTLMKINDMRNLRVEADLNEIEVNKIDIGANAELTFDSMPTTSFIGKVDYLSAFGVQDSSTSTLYKFPVRVKFQTEGKLVRPGISANITIVVERAENVVSLPASAVFIEDDTRFVFIKRGEHRFERRKVEIGVGNLNFIEIKSGVKEGDEVATTRPSQSEIIGNERAGGKRGGPAPSGNAADLVQRKPSGDGDRGGPGGGGPPM